MNVKEWVEQFPPDQRKAERERIAAKIQVSEMAVRQWCYGNNRPSGVNVPLLEHVTEGGFAYYFSGAPFVRGLVGVSRYDVRPDIYGQAPARVA